MMIIRVEKASSEILDQIANLVLANEPYRRESFPTSADKTSLLATFRKLGPQWTILTHEQTLALFVLSEIQGHGSIDYLCLRTPETITNFASEVINELEKTPITNISLTTNVDLAERLVVQGFTKKSTILNFSRQISETQFMPILPITNPKSRDLPSLAKLMHEAYAKGRIPKYASSDEAAKRLQEIVSNREYLAECSFVSGSGGNYVSACFVTSPSKGAANISELFTHPLYRARGLATSEVAMAMNRLAKRNYSKLNVWGVDDGNDVACRLFSKLGFEQTDKKMTVSKSLKKTAVL
ncbi:MAG: GNAT family N-acetyltransferase [Candidatus Bathyarchaeia archaeon]